MDTIFLHGLVVNCVVGVWEWEQRMTQKIVVDLDMQFDVLAAAESDELADTLDYKAVADAVTELLETSRFQLIETMAESVARLVREQFAVPWLRVSINKGGVVSGVDSVGVVIERGQR